jgi:pimeloyl-ACP methyl ester carboxylesterase
VQPQTRYGDSGGVSVAYQVVGDGPIDLVYVPGWVSNIEYCWEEPSLARYYRRLASFSRLILFDKRGTGLSDRVAAYPTLDERMDDVRAVLDAVGSERAAVFGHSEGGSLAVLFAASHPERTLALVTVGIFAKRVWSEDLLGRKTPAALMRHVRKPDEGRRVRRASGSRRPRAGWPGWASRGGASGAAAGRCRSRRTRRGSPAGAAR